MKKQTVSFQFDTTPAPFRPLRPTDAAAGVLLLLARTLGRVAALMSNAFCAAAAVHYCYVTFLGYQTLGTLRDARVFLLPVPLIVIVATVASLLGVNILALTIHLVYH